MATNLNISENQERVPLTVGSRGVLRSITPDNGSPYYVGARAYVTQTASGAIVTVIDKDGTTTATILNGTNGTNGTNGQDGQDGADGNGIVDITLTSSSANVDEYTITYDNGDTDVFYVTNGIDGQDGADGADGADGYSPTATVTKSGDTATITITDKDGTTTASISDGSGGASAFVAEFNVTTYADVKDAYDDDAIIICTADDSGNTMILQLVYFDATNEIFFFAEPNGDGLYWTELSNANGWNDGTRFLASTDVATQLADGLMSALDKQKLDGLSKRNIWYGTCSTSASSSPKVVTTASGDFSLTNGSMLVVKFSNTNSLSSASLQVDGGTAKAVYQLDGTSNIANRWGGGEVVMFAYDGTKFILLDQTTASTTQYGITKLNNTVTSTSTSEAATANAVKSAYDHGGVTSVNGSTGAVTVTVPTITDTYDGTSSDGMSGKAVKSAIDALDGTVSGSAGSGKTLTAFSQTDGKVSATFGNISIIKSQVSDFPTIPTNVSDLNNDSGFTATSITRYTTTGTNIADLTIDGTTTKLYAPTGGGGGITDVTVDGTSVVSGTTAAIDLTGKSDVGHTHTKSAITDFPTTVSSFTNDAGYITGYTETDPIFTASAASGISSSDITAWNGKPAFGLGIPYGACSTAGGTVQKEVSITGVTALTTGLTIAVKFTNANSASSPTLKVNTLDAKSIKRYGTTAPSTSAATSWNAGSVILLTYDGTYWQQIGFLNSTYSEITSANITNGSGSSTGLVSGRRAKSAVETFAPVKDVTVGGTSVMSGTTAVVPAIPTVNDATLTIQKNGTDVATFTANASSNVTANISVPTDTGDLTNGAGYITGVTSTSTPTASTISEFDASSHINSADMSAQDVSDFVDSLTPSGSKISDWELLDSATFTSVTTITHTLNDVDTASITDFFITGACLSATIPKCGGRTSFSATGYYYVSSQYTLRIYFDIVINSATQLTIRYRLEAKGSSDSYPTYQLYYRHKES